LGSERIGWDVLGLLKLLIVYLTNNYVFTFYGLEQDGIVVWPRESHLFVLILLENIL